MLFLPTSRLSDSAGNECRRLEESVIQVMGALEQMANAAVFMAFDQANGITGSTRQLGHGSLYD
jgi:hypothetical protein